MCESRGQFGSSDKPRVVPWAQSMISKWTGFSRIAAAVLLPRKLLDKGNKRRAMKARPLANVMAAALRRTVVSSDV
jgi:hypothetical protein